MTSKFSQSTIQFIAQRQWLIWFWSFLILVACTWPGKDLPAAPVLGFDKIVHSGLFTVWAILALIIYPEKSLLVVGLGMAYGLGLEFYQQLLPFDRTFDWWDAVADAAGVLIGYLFTKLVLKN
ncbi:VanZ family protein [Dyadobacter jiangsuensis]|uniref:VanZ like protein n=1 Tax=Dyadobacter jiangsuensis TaxID=1591085 RepID=A0A2P8FRL6_9BACT|nr:VanZ family protein [Dyadobacter jiangsuensis]PSL24372.1 VanZ like protein [Dyadobacter jiangsuensis]